MKRLLCMVILVGIFARPLFVAATVTVEDEEVVFTIAADGASKVFLVGDFNNWNPTLEKMDRVGNLFKISLFMLPGGYRYKFVVDGQWVNDPGNAPSNPEMASTVTLVMRAGMLTIGNGEPAAEDSGSLALQPSFRYTGRFLEDSDIGSDQTLDFYFDYETKRVRSHVDFNTVDDTWGLSPLQTDIRFNNGYLHLRFDNATIAGFENQQTWMSSDPFRLVGDVGIYDYSTGRGRKGASIELGNNSRVKFKALYADRIEDRLQSPLSIPASDFSDFAGSTAPDTTVYSYDPGLEDEDAWAIDLSADFGGLQLGYGLRRNRGFHPGLLTTVVRGSGDFTVKTFGTREYWSANAAWLSWGVLPNVVLEGAYGHGRSYVKRLRGSESVVGSLGDVALGQDATDLDDDTDLQQSQRWRGGAVYREGPWTAGADFEWNKFDFDRGIYDSSRANIAVASVRASFEAARWSVGGAVSYVDQDYGSTPDDFHFHTPNRNSWLDYGDNLTMAHMAGFDLARFSELSLQGEWNSVDSTATPYSVSVSAEFDMVWEEFMGSVDYYAVRAIVEYRPWWRLYVQGDGRVAVYDKPWSSDAFFAPYVELGYRHRHLEFSLGLGLDPYVLDPVTNTYRDNGRQEYLRQVIPNNLARSQAGELGTAIAERERRLEDVNAIKLEAIISF